MTADQKAYNEAQNTKIDCLMKICIGIKNVLLETHCRYGLVDGVATTVLEEVNAHRIFEFFYHPSEDKRWTKLDNMLITKKSIVIGFKALMDRCGNNDPKNTQSTSLNVLVQ